MRTFKLFFVSAILLILSGCDSIFDTCGTPPEGWAYLGNGQPLPMLETIPAGLRIVTLGSSSTEGIGATVPAKNYPFQLQRVLDRRFPDEHIEVINSGVAGEVVADNLVRLDRDVLSLTPDLVIWQLGTNDTIYVRDAVTVMEQVQVGITRIQNSGARLALLSLQPVADEARGKPMIEMNNALRAIALKNNVPFLDRHYLMSWWISSGSLYEDEVVGADQLHMTDRSYECLGIRMADVIPGLAEGLVPRPRATMPAAP